MVERGGMDILDQGKKGGWLLTFRFPKVSTKVEVPMNTVLILLNGTMW